MNSRISYPLSRPAWRLAAIVLLAAASLAHACSVPVFRYALDRWPADAFHLDAPAAALREEPLAGDLRGDGGVRLNIEALPRADAAASREARLTFPAESAEAAELWKGELTAAAYRELVDSPARAEIARRVLAGESGIWVLVESGDRDADTALAGLLSERIAAIEKTAQLPVIRPDDPSSQLGPGPKLGIHFSLLRIARSDARERMTVAMLAGPNGLPAFPPAKPFAALVFGRGRVLGAWTPEKLTTQLVEEAGKFLLRACSCEAKRLNPGWDLLLRVNWDAELEKIAQARTAAGDIPAPQSGSPKPETVTFQPAPIPQPSPPRAKTILLIAAVALLVLGLVIGGRKSA